MGAGPPEGNKLYNNPPLLQMHWKGFKSGYHPHPYNQDKSPKIQINPLQTDPTNPKGGVVKSLLGPSIGLNGKFMRDVGEVQFAPVNYTTDASAQYVNPVGENSMSTYSTDVAKQFHNGFADDHLQHPVTGAGVALAGLARTMPSTYGSFDARALRKLRTRRGSMQDSSHSSFL